MGKSQEKKFIKRGYNFTKELIAEWERFHCPFRDFSPSAGAAFLLYMVADPALHSKLKRLAVSADMKNAKIEARELLRKTVMGV
jgi:hypothetical protein